MITLALDPGLRGCGVAVFEDAELSWAAYVRGSKTAKGVDAWLAMADAVCVAVKAQGFQVESYVFEKMQRDSRSLNIQALFDLYGVAAWTGASIKARQVTGYFPREWKGNVPKDIHNRRTEKQLSVAELANIAHCPTSLLHNVWDAIGIGLFHLSKNGVR